MKKIAFIFIFILFFVNSSAKADFMPTYTNSLKHTGIGALKVGNDTKIYEKQDEKSKIVQRIYWNNIGNFLIGDTSSSGEPKDIFLVYMPEKNMAFFTVEDENDEWANICYDQKNLKFGWVKKGASAKFITWRDFFYTYGKEYGIYAFRNLPKELRSLHGAPNDDSMVIDGFEVVKFMTPWLIQGNWMLIKAATYDQKVKTGWFKWRSDTGKIYAFVDFR